VERVDVVIVGGGQAGLSTSCELTRRDVDHVVLERARIGQSWRARWDSFCLVTPNWTVQLPGHHYDGNDPDGFMPRDEIVAYLERYATVVGAPVREGVDVAGVDRASDGAFSVRTSDGEVRARAVVLANGAYQRPIRPAADTLPPDLLQLDLDGYHNAGTLPEGPVLIVGSGQSGCQLAEELLEAGRDVVLACGKAPWSLRRIGGRDVVWWLQESGYLDATVDTLPSPSARYGANILATGHGGGHDLHLRTLHAAGVTLTGRFLGAAGTTAAFADDFAESIAWGDARYRIVADLVRKVVAEHGLDEPELPEPAPFTPRTPETIDLRGFGAVLFTGGFRPDYSAWLPWPDAFDDLGFPIHREGASTVVDGLYFVGVHWLRKRKSSILLGVGEDAAIVAGAVASRLRRVR
jgi:putative flavoprotein involved in K+ transport